MKRLWLLALAVTLVPAVNAQQRDTQEVGRLRQEIERRFTSYVQQELDLTTEQATKLRASQEKFSTRRLSCANMSARYSGEI